MISPAQNYLKWYFNVSQELKTISTYHMATLESWDPTSLVSSFMLCPYHLLFSTFILLKSGLFSSVKQSRSLWQHAMSPSTIFTPNHGVPLSLFCIMYIYVLTWITIMSLLKKTPFLIHTHLYKLRVCIMNKLRSTSFSRGLEKSSFTPILCFT